MKIYAFIHMHNEASSGNLERCLKNCSDWSDNIIIYDGKSTDNSVEIAKKYTEHIILGETSKLSISIRQQMLTYIHNMDKKPDWIFWIDCDEILDRSGIKNIRIFCENNKNDECAGFALQQINLWRGERFYRIDKNFYRENYEQHGVGWFVRLWKYSPDLTMNTCGDLNMKSYPINIKITKPTPFKIIHYGFSNFKNLMKRIGVHTCSKQELIDYASGDMYIKLVENGCTWAKQYIVDGKGCPNMFLDETGLMTKQLTNISYPFDCIPELAFLKPEPKQWNELIPYSELV